MPVTDPLLEEAQREVDAMLPGTPPIAPALPPRQAPWWQRRGIAGLVPDDVELRR